MVLIDTNVVSELMRAPMTPGAFIVKRRATELKERATAADLRRNGADRAEAAGRDSRR